MVRIVIGVTLLLVASLMGIAFLSGSASAQPIGIQIFAAVISSVVPGLAGLALMRQGRRALRGVPDAAAVPIAPPEVQVVRLAARKSGRLTVVEVIAETSLGAEDAEAALAKVVEQGLAEPQVTDKGLIVYVFPDVEQLKDKKGARGLLEE